MVHIPTPTPRARVRGVKNADDILRDLEEGQGLHKCLLQERRGGEERDGFCGTVTKDRPRNHAPLAP